MPGESRDIVPREAVLTEEVVVVVTAVFRLAEETNGVFTVTEDDELGEINDETDDVICSDKEADDCGRDKGGAIIGALMITLEPSLTGRDPTTTPGALGEMIRNLCTPLTPDLEAAVINWMF